MQMQGLKIQEAQDKIQQDAATLEKTKLANLVADTGFKASEESKAKLKQLAQTDEFKAADDEQKLRLSAAVQFQNGDVENGSKTLTAAELYATRAVAIKQRDLDQQAQQVGNAYGVISAVPDDRVQEFVDNLPEASKKALVSQIGEANWNKMSGAEKKEAAKNLMLNAKGQMATQLKAIELEKQALVNASRERIATIQADARIQSRHIGADRDMRDWNIYTKAQESIEKSGKKTLETLDKNVETAQANLDKTWFFSATEKADYEKAVKARDDFKRNQIKKEITLATSAPNFPGKNIVLDNLKNELELYGKEVTPLKIEEDEPALKPTAAKPAATPVAATSNKPAAPKFEEGKVYTDAKGNKAKYVNGKWEPQ
jgi:hypothetical protein